MEGILKSGIMPPTPNRVYRLSDATTLYLEALREVFPRSHATYEDVLAELVRFYLSHQRAVTADVRDFLRRQGYADLAETDFSRPSRYDVPPEQRRRPPPSRPPEPRSGEASSSPS